MVGCDRREEEKLLRREDKIFLSLLRSDAPVATVDLDPARDASQDPLPSVFLRLTDHRRWTEREREKEREGGREGGERGRESV